MSPRPTRVALFPDSYSEVNGVANTVRRFESFAREREFPLLVVAGAEQTRRHVEGSFTRLELRRGPLSFALDKDLRFDLAFLRHHRAITDAVCAFQPDVVHITGPSDVGIAGMTIAHELGIPLVASWHTNVHEYAGKRAVAFIPEPLEGALAAKVQDTSFALTARYYKVARLLFAPNQELIDQLKAATGKPCFLMSRGVDSEAFSPKFRDRADDGRIDIGYVGRLTTEKNIRDFAELGKMLMHAGITNFRFVFVGQGSDSDWLREHVPNAVMTGVKKGPELARAYANFDIFAFPSKTDTFGNVVLEALASGVPSVVTSEGGPKFIVTDGQTGLIAPNLAQFANSLIRLATSAELRRQMSAAARVSALRSSWASVFESVYEAYETQLGELPGAAGSPIPNRLASSHGAE